MTGAIFSAVRPVRPSIQAHADLADALALQADGGAEDQFALFGMQNVDGTDGGVESALDEADDVGQRFGGVVAVRDQLADLFERQQQ